ncbi:AraC family transcriptional regulator [Oleiagrimonas sp. C23AA]|uniref:AraC family transcriptional regulator n=1 Tax=Oleiagrimonas sp. C23AA TaxID=2719047 RepID=UPI001423FA44|nr:AraC family transcriptional regulator [Oleiagrimonas sp. C23AA]NII11794.1 AraC family transcriptional regulator [Oleiagrimonas sp. C23AA]
MADTLLALTRRYVAAQTTPSPYFTDVPGLVVMHTEHAQPPSHLLMKPALCLVLQGAKWSMFGGRRHHYGPGDALLVSVEMPSVGSVVKASPEEPYLALAIGLDMNLMREVLEQLESPPTTTGNTRHGVFVSHFDGALADCARRLVALLDTPQAAPVVQPLIMREICYWLLTGPHGGDFANVVLGNSHAQRIVRAIHVLRERYDQPVRIEELAAVAKLSASAFHRQFKALTSMTPLQYQKQLRLLQARELMLSGQTNAETAANQVGYESASQFSREYTRMFGAPPKRHTVSESSHSQRPPYS